MLKNIEEFSDVFRENKDTREFSLKYKLLMIILMCLFESSNQYFYYSARYIQLKSLTWRIFVFVTGNTPSHTAFLPTGDTF